MISRIFRFTWAVYFLVLFLLFFLLFYPFFLILLNQRSTYRLAHKLRAIWGRTIMFLSGLRPRTTFVQPLEKKKVYVFAANHFSYLDILSLNVQLGHYFRFMAKSELRKIPLFGIFFRTIDISVNRKSITDSVYAFGYADRAVKEGDSLGIFPEGGIGDQVPKMRAFKSGAFKLAVENKVAIVPISIIDNWKRMPDGGLTSGGLPGKMRMIVHAPIETNNLDNTDIPRLKKEVYDIIQKSVDSLTFE